MKHIKYILVIVLILVMGAALILYNKSQVALNQKFSTGLVLDEKNFKNYIDSNPLRAQIIPLQSYLLSDIKKGRNDDFTKSAAYWLSHRYFDNGGDIYEIYDYIKANPELAFLNEAEQIHPESFEAIRKGGVKGYSSVSMIAYLSYLEVLEKYGYLGLSGLTTLSSSMISYVYFGSEIQSRSASTSISLDEHKEKNKFYIAKSLIYAEKANLALDKVMKGDKSGFVTDNDLVVSLNQYAMALQTYKALKVDFKSNYTAEQIFDLAAVYAENTSLNYFSNYTRAYSYILTKEINTENIRSPLSLIYNSNIPNPPVRTFLYRIINSKDGAQGGGLYSYATSKELAKYSPEFKNWLKKNGWVDQDF